MVDGYPSLCSSRSDKYLYESKKKKTNHKFFFFKVLYFLWNPRLSSLVLALEFIYFSFIKKRVVDS